MTHQKCFKAWYMNTPDSFASEFATLAMLIYIVFMYRAR